jgi:glycosyltransferase involved in cell wall biosynthesis
VSTIIHLLSGLEIGGKEAAALRSARRGIAERADHRLVLYDTPFRSAELDFDPAGVPITFISRTSGLDFKFAFRLATHFAALNVDIVHAYNDTALFYAAVSTRLQMRSRPRLVSTFHTWPSHPTRGARWLTRWASGRFDAVVAVSDDLRGRLLSSGWVKDCRTIVNGVDLTKFSPLGETDKWRVQLGVPLSAFFVGHIARFDDIKRHHDLLEAARLLQEGAPDVVLVLVGRGPLRDDIRKLAHDYKNIRFVSQIANVAPFLRSLDLFVLCSEYEGTPLVLLEAMACGCPVVATHVGGIPGVVGAPGDNACAIMIPPFRPDLLAASIKRLARDPEECRRLSDNALRRAPRFSFENEWEAYKEIYAPATA